MTHLSVLLDKLRAADRSTPELDAHLWCALGSDEPLIYQHHQITASGNGWEVYGRRPASGRVCGHIGLIRYTESIDAALVLLTRHLPGWNCVLNTLHPGAVVHNPDNPRQCYPTTGATVPLAILTAVVAALAAQEPPDDRS